MSRLRQAQEVRESLIQYWSEMEAIAFIRDYVNRESPEDDQAVLVQKIGSKRVVGIQHKIYDVHCTSTRWWVITNPTNLYLQTHYPEVEHALMFHVGLGAMLAERSRSFAHTSRIPRQDAGNRTGAAG